MRKHIFIINGAAGSGKDTFVDLVNIATKSMDEVGSVENFSSVDKIKEVAKSLGWDGTKDEKDRKFLSDLKSLCKEYNDLPFKSIIHTVSNFNKSLNEQFLFIHIREPDEIERAKVAFGAKTILIKRNLVNPIVSNESDKNVFEYNYDIVINNNSNIHNLSCVAKKFLYDIIKKEPKNEY